MFGFFYQKTQTPETGYRYAARTEWFNAENDFNPDYKMIVVDCVNFLITLNGFDWYEIEEDHL